MCALPDGEDKEGLAVELREGIVAGSADVNIMTKLDCRQCVSEERITKWVTEEAQRSLANGWSEAQVKAITECTARTLIGDLRSKPELGDIVRDRYNSALSACAK